MSTQAPASRRQSIQKIAGSSEARRGHSGLVVSTPLIVQNAGVSPTDTPVVREFPRSRSYRVMIVEDHFLARIALRGMLGTLPGFSVVAETNRGEEAIRLYREHRPDVVIMDLKLHESSGFEAIRFIHGEFPSSRILVLSNFQGTEDVYEAVHSGARGYLTKDADGTQLANALSIVATGGRYLPEWLEGKLAERIPGPAITPREKDVLQLLAKGMSTVDIANQIHVAEKTVRIHISNMLEKLGARDRTQALVLALQRGIIHLDS